MSLVMDSSDFFNYVENILTKEGWSDGRVEKTA
jgi:hypothetical protein